jgi:putative aldouronate transport system permease protein
MKQQKLRGLPLARPRLRGLSRLEIGRYRFLYLLVLPGFLYFLIFHYLPLLGIVIAFKDYRAMGGVAGIISAPWVGFRYFNMLFQSEYFWRLLRNTLWISTLRLIFEFPAPVLFALLLNEIYLRRFRRVVQTITYLPHFLSWVVVAGLAIQILSPSGGPVNALIEALGGQAISFVADPRYFRGVLVGSGVWHELGWSSIIYLAAITNVPQEQYEAADIEGATRLQKARFVTFPSITFIVVLLLILRVGRLINENFEQIFNLYNPTVYSVADVFETYIYRRGLLQSDFSYATAVGIFKSVTSLILVMGANRVAKVLGQESLW